VIEKKMPRLFVRDQYIIIIKLQIFIYDKFIRFYIITDKVWLFIGEGNKK